MAGLQFGMSLDPYSVPQRHCFYDSDEEQDEIDEEELSLSIIDLPENCPKLKSKLLIIATSTIAAAFIRSHVITDPNPLSSIVTKQSLRAFKGKYFSPSGEQTDHHEETITDVFLLKEKKDVCICIHEQPLREEYCNEWSRKLLGATNPDQVIILHSLPLHQYFSSEEDESSTHHLTCLLTRFWKQDPLARFLSPSNIVSGEPAAVLTQCQLSGTSAAVAVLFTSNTMTITEQIQSYRPLLSHPVLAGNLSILPFNEANKNIAAYVPKPRTDKNTLYT